MGMSVNVSDRQLLCFSCIGDHYCSPCILISGVSERTDASTEYRQVEWMGAWVCRWIGWMSG